MQKRIDRLENEAIAAALKRARVEAALSQSEVASAQGRPQTWASRLELGKIKVDVLTLRDWASVCGLTLSQIVAFVEAALGEIPRSKRQEPGAREARKYIAGNARKVESKVARAKKRQK